MEHKDMFEKVFSESRFVEPGKELFDGFEEKLESQKSKKDRFPVALPNPSSLSIISILVLIMGLNGFVIFGTANSSESEVSDEDYQELFFFDEEAETSEIEGDELF